MLPAFLTTILFSISAVCAQRTTKVLGGVEANFWRIVVATVFLAAWAHTLGQGLAGKALPMFLLSGFVGFGIGDLALYQTLPRLGSRLSILLIHCIAAPFASVTEWLWLGVRMNGTEVVGVMLILAGVALALAPGKHLDIPCPVFWTGVACGVVAALGQGLGAVLSSYASRVDESAGMKIDGLTAAYQRILAGLVVGAVVYAIVKLRRKTSAVEPATTKRSRLWAWVLGNALAGPAIGVGCYQWALMEAKTGVVLAIVALTPLVIIPFSRFVEGERPQKRSLAGGIVAVLGVILLRLASAK
ncbi:MAG TPA: DMT family transporter [Candidatus Acidoferrum sp.]|nr:DMT family transporter [Candidatus Acidoferrum sp.]